MKRQYAFWRGVLLNGNFLQNSVECFLAQFPLNLSERLYVNLKECSLFFFQYLAHVSAIL
ncbi:hypothetical protein MNBD_PLANCTO02-448 [hydrothermal vent metagenome]|uniref:Uncharacterized protein n=1 Tax=hydrothermal vent metagenome TaxID=652676 RepID=A0A3B1DVQ8_9ZZZZ